MTDTTRLQKAAGVMESRPEAGTVVLLNLNSNAYFSLEGAGAVAWDALDATFGEVLGTVLDEFEVEPEVARRDLSELLEELVQNGLVRVE